MNFIITFFVLYSCFQVVNPQDYIPLEVGNYWKFRSPHEFIVDRDSLIDGVRWFHMPQFPEPPCEDIWLRYDDNGDLVYIHAWYGEKVLLPFSKIINQDEYGPFKPKCRPIRKNMHLTRKYQYLRCYIWWHDDVYKCNKENILVVGSNFDSLYWDWDPFQYAYVLCAGIGFIYGEESYSKDGWCDDRFPLYEAKIGDTIYTKKNLTVQTSSWTKIKEP